MQVESDAKVNVNKKEASNLHILRLSMLYFAVGMVMFLIAMVAAVWIIPQLVEVQSMRNQSGLFLAHILLLGWATTVAMGASFQLVQVVMRSPLYSRSMGYIQFVLYTLGYLLMITGFIVEPKLIVVGGVCVAVGVLLYAINITMTFILKREWNVFVLGVSLSILALLITISLGIRLGLAIAYAASTTVYDIILGSHLWFGIAGWLSGFIIIFSIKLLPMFYVSAKKPGRDAYWIIAAYHAGLWMQAIALWSSVEWFRAVASVIMIAAFGWFVVYVYNIRKLSRSKRPVGVVSIALHLIPMMCLLLLLWSGSYSLFGGQAQLHEIMIIILVLGWFSASILSYLSKILPFLWWAHRYQTKEEKKGAVLLTNMLPERRMTVELLGYLCGIVVVLVGCMLVLPEMARIGQIVAVGFVIVYLVELSRTFRY